MWVDRLARALRPDLCWMAAGAVIAAVIARPVSAQDSTVHVRAIVRDSAANRPVSGASLRVISSGQTFSTDTSGTASVAIPSVGGSIIVTAIGFTPETLLVTSPADLTIRMRRVQVLAEHDVVASRESGAERKLRQFGFLERRKSSGAPASAFVTEADLRRWRPGLLSEVSLRIGRGLTSCTVYLDGIITAVPRPMRGASQPYRTGVDAVIQPSEILAMEVYRIAEAPIEYPVRGRDSCSLVIWLK